MAKEGVFENTVAKYMPSPIRYEASAILDRISKERGSIWIPTGDLVETAYLLDVQGASLAYVECHGTCQAA